LKPLKLLKMSPNQNKPKLKMAVYWAASCGGCCVSVLDVHEKLFDVLEAADLVFWPIALDFKYKDLQAMPDGHIDITLFNGAIRNSENEEMAQLLRHKSKILIAYGSCAHMGGIPGLANMSTRQEIFDRVYVQTESTVNPGGTFPQILVDVDEGHLHLPSFYNDVKALDQVVCVDYYMPGCPPQTERLLEVFMAVAGHKDLPPRRSVIGALDKAQCDECTRKRSENKRITIFKRPFEIEDDGETCFLEQGVICMGPATRGGCGYRCIEGNAPCRGCYGPSPDVLDPGAKMMSAIGTMIDSDDASEIERITEGVIDPAGTFYRFSMPSAIIRRKQL
jgi:F420-non-reducing hydrogenase small subunit